MSKYSDLSLKEVMGWFHLQPTTEEEKSYKIICAGYSRENYTGSAFVLLKKGKELFEVNGSHCSCYGLEGQWEPELTTLESLYHRATKGYPYGEFANLIPEMKSFFGNKWK